MNGNVSKFTFTTGMAVFFLSFILIAGCSDDSGNSNLCTPQCEAGEECVDGVCTSDSLQCDPACGPPEICQNGTCVHDPMECDPICESGFSCIRGTCVSDTPDCNPPCGPDEECSNGECIPIGPPQCNPTCNPSEVCENGHCVPIVPDCFPPCGRGTYCIDGVCVPESDCNPPCQFGETCEEGQCIPISTGLNCPEIFFCSMDCGDSTVCLMDCYSRGSSSAQELVMPVFECAENSDCEDEDCFLETCRTEIAICMGDEPGPCNPPCRSGEVCERGTCIPIPGQNCQEVFDCGMSCDLDDESCLEECMSQGTPEAQEISLELYMCAMENQCDEIDCLYGACQNQMLRCLGDLPNQCNPPCAYDEVCQNSICMPVNEGATCSEVGECALECGSFLEYECRLCQGR